jgi:selenocysteine-specific elongation factor
VARLREHEGEIDPSMAREELRQRAGSPPQKLFARSLTALAEKGELRADAERVRPPGAAAPLSGPNADAQEKLAGLLDSGGLSPPRANELPALIDQTPQKTQALLKALSGAGRAVKVSEELWFGAAALLDLRRKLLAHLAARGSIDAQGFKELTGLTRKFAIPLLEYFDKEKLTLRIGDKRVLRKQQ